MQKTINECVGFADGCHGCGRDCTPVTVCDNCGAVCTDLVFHAHFDNQDLCLNCAVDQACEDFRRMSSKEQLKLMDYEEEKP